MPFANPFEAHDAGIKGGKSRTARKRRAARKNGRSGGRERQSTLAEFILRRKLTPEQHKVVAEGFFRLTYSERNAFRKFFTLNPGVKIKKDGIEPYFDPATKDGVRPTKPTPQMRHILRKFRLIARWRLAGGD